MWPKIIRYKFSYGWRFFIQSRRVEKSCVRNENRYLFVNVQVHTMYFYLFTLNNIALFLLSQARSISVINIKQYKESHESPIFNLSFLNLRPSICYSRWFTGTVDVRLKTTSNIMILLSSLHDIKLFFNKKNRTKWAFQLCFFY